MKIKEFILYQDDGILVTAENEEDALDGIFVHTKIDKITPSQYKDYKKKWKTIVQNLGYAGIKNIYATPLEPMDEKWETKFGFKWTGLMMDGCKLMRYRGE